ncbi:MULTISPECIES: DNA polymerase III subunit alpha [Psychrobacter]|uniref:DNA polymerase III subunit alpha n=1 Tax=Psychrobacter TaxID=497 RepID=UPI00086DF7C9|nr:MULTISPECIES: DNA polymerase III subunit alpha [Psychrobacter]MBA6245268.1 DNA polymerase III subunit alpha [Psychrobacter sp. Urea-trap-18]MBA6285669.1 DNA polymerase III subunit alpha [Psychrobacter sp. Urea-trap-16]MBA6318916.1 DNA polymerase III subunit alpha [Psychrobacter sp. Urea-trap-20]MBA6333943.1 DNA polymerase III subunit alpha [Psychrobacter sp. Urea-trap-19]OEH68885.1 MAG: DNA polymerase III subunit alpha [Psychrobacter sp. B29-1]|tara:strand:- start:736 stop:4455 length:3720 start_codon:yes stop_codon:yes gene_type:complete
MAFVHLGIHSEYSITDSIVRIKPLVKAAAADNQRALALTDLSNLYATVKFYRACLGAGIKPIIGSEVIMDNEDTRLTLLAMNNEGYQNITRIVSLGFTEGRADPINHGTPVIKRSHILEHAAGVIVLLTEKSDVGQALVGSMPEKADELLTEWQAQFDDRLYFAIKRTNRSGEDAFIRAAIHSGAKHNIPIIAHNDVRFLEQDDFDAHEARVCIAGSYVLADPNRPQTYSDEQYLKTQAQMEQLFADIPQVIDNTLRLATRCNVTLTLGINVLPDFPVPAGETIESFFRAESQRGLEQRLDKLFPVEARTDNWNDFRQRYDERLAYELDIILSMGFPGYFLIVMDFIRWAKANGVPVGPGRGSGAGSLVAYALNITDLDPIHYDLLFERFLNPERVSMPDFDIDFCIEGRDRVIDYVAQTYGRDAVSQIITFGTMAAKAVVRDVARVQSKSYFLANKISKLIPKTPGITLSQALEQEPQLKDLISNPDNMDYEDAIEIWEMAIKLEGVCRNVGKHAGGVLIAPHKITDFSAIYCDDEGHRVSQFDKDDVEAVGLVKFDFLGLRNLTVINAAVENINLRRAKENVPALVLEDLPLDDSKAYKLLQDAKTTAVFQLESMGMKKYLAKLQPTNIEDVIAMCALYRPGPLDAGMVEMYIDRKHGREEVIYDHPNLEPILENTNGVIVYQEQVMQISQVMAGYSLGGADMLRRAMGKKKPEEMAKQRDIFVTGATSQGIDEVTSGGVFDLMEKFAGYGFNRSHSAAYGVLAYQTAYLKQYYPAEFMAAVLTSDMNNTDNVVFFINDCRENFGLTVVNPSVNRSEWHFVADTPTNIIYGLGAIKGVGEGAVESIVDARRTDGPFKDLYDFCRRVDIKKVNKRTLEALVSAGCFDDFAATLRPDLPADEAYEIRGALMSQLPSAVQAAEQDRQNREIGMMDLFGEMDGVVAAPPLVMTPELIWGDKHRLKAEKNTLGLYLTGHPINEYLDELKRYTSGARLDKLTDTGYNGSCYFSGLIIDIANFGNRNVITLDDGTSRLEVSCYAERFNRVKEQLKIDEVVIIKGSIRERDGRLFARLDSAMSMVDARLRWLKKISIKVHGSDINLLTRLQPLLKSAQADIIPEPRLAYNQEQDEQSSSGSNVYDPAMGGSLYDENGNDLLALESDMNHDAANQNGMSASYANNALSNTDASINDNCLPLGLSIYEVYGIANVGLSEHWRVYPNDDNLQTLKTLVSEENLHFHYS